jgi:tight adherence protein B
MSDLLLQQLFSFYGLAVVLALAVMAGAIAYTVSGLRQYGMERRIQRIAGGPAPAAVGPELRLVREDDRVEGAILRFFPSVRQTQLRLRRAGGAVSIRLYVLLLLLATFSASLLLTGVGPFALIPDWGMPVLMLFLAHVGANAVVLPFFTRRRQNRILKQMPEVIDFVVRAIIVGQSLEVALREASDAFQGPLAQDLALIPKLVDVGVPLPEAMRTVALEVDMAEFDFLVAACVAQLQSGGGLADVLRGLSETIRARHQLRQKVAAMTAEGRVSVGFLACLPIGLFLYLLVTQEGYMDPLFTSDVGQVIFYAIFGLIATGVAVAWRLVQLKV